jgi:diaminopimelate decarboxylase
VTSKPVHAPLTQFPVVDGQLIVAGKTVRELALIAGQTPFYAYDLEAIARRVAELRAALPNEIRIHYAVKANPMPAVVHHLAGLVDGLDVASAGELRTALATRTAPDQISFAGPGKTEAELGSAVAAGITVNVESATEVERLSAISDREGIAAHIAVRVNPDFELKHSGMKMGGGPKQFGVDAELVPNLLARISEAGLHFRGFHIFSGSQNLRAENVVEAQCATFELAFRLAEHAPGRLETLNIGGGFGIPYFAGEQPLDLGPISENLAKQLTPAKERLGVRLEVVIELGRYLVGEAGIYVCEVIDKKVSRGHIYLVTNGGLHHHLAASGNFGQVIRKNYPVIIPDRIGATPMQNSSVVGPLCTPLDLLADRVELPAIPVGNLVAILQSGAYGYSASPHRFLGHPTAHEIAL